MGHERAIVIVAEDDPDARLLYTQWLEQAGFTVYQATDGEEAVSLALQHRPAALLMDLQMPGMDGWEAIQVIRAEIGPAPYILVVTAHYGEGRRQEALDVGADEFIAKPVAPDVLCTAVTTALRRREQG